MKKWATIVLLAALLALPASGRADGEESNASGGERGSLPLTLERALSLALTKNSELLVEMLNSRITDVDMRSSRSIYDPFLSGSLYTGGSKTAEVRGTSSSAGASVGVTQLIPSGGSLSAQLLSSYYRAPFDAPGFAQNSYTTTTTVTFSQPLLRNFGVEATEVNIILSRRSYEDSLERYRYVAASTVLEVASAFYKLYSLRQTQETRNAALASAQSLLAETASNPEKHPPGSIEMTNAEYGVVQRLKDSVDAERNVRDQEAALLYLTGMTTKEEIVTSPPAMPLDETGSLGDAVAAALAKRSDLKLLNSSYEASRLLTKTASERQRPDVSLFIQGDLNGSGPTSSDTYRQMAKGQSNWSTGFTFSYPFGNGALKGDYERSLIKERQTRIQIEALMRKIQNDVEADFRALISTRLQLRVTERALEQAKQRAEQYRKSNEEGTSTTQDVLLAEADLAGARTSRIDALETHASTLMKLWFDTGELLEKMGVVIAAPARPE